jgi:hypothetical protein
MNSGLMVVIFFNPDDLVFVRIDIWVVAQPPLGNTVWLLTGYIQHLSTTKPVIWVNFECEEQQLKMK